MSGAGEIAALRARAEDIAADARKRPGLYETDAHVIAELYDFIASLCAILQETGQ